MTEENTATEVTKTQRFKIYIDASGKEIERKPMTKGRMPRNSKIVDGNFVITVTPETSKKEVFYVALNADGSLKEKVVRGRGRARKGYVLQHDGEYAGSYVKKEEAPKAEAPKAEEPKAE